MLRSPQRRLRLRLHLEKKMSFEEVRNASLNAFAMVFSMMKSLLLFTIITNPLILHFHTGILIRSVLMC